MHVYVLYEYYILLIYLLIMFLINSHLSFCQCIFPTSLNKGPSRMRFYCRHDRPAPGVEPGHPRGLPRRRHRGSGQEEGQPQLLRLEKLSRDNSMILRMQMVSLNLNKTVNYVYYCSPFWVCSQVYSVLCISEKKECI